MQDVVIDLTKEPEIADTVADMQPGDRFSFHGTIKSLDDQTLVVTIDEHDTEKRDPDKDVETKPAPRDKEAAY